MEAAVVKPKPRMRPLVRDRLPRFFQIYTMRTEEKAPLQLVRLAMVSRAQLASVRRRVPVLTFTLWDLGWKWLMPDMRLDCAAKRIDVSPTEMSGIAKVLRVPVHLRFFQEGGLEFVDWEEMEQVEEFVRGLELWEDYHRFPVLLRFVNEVLPQLNELQCSTDVLNRLPPLDLNKLQLYRPGPLHDAVSRHTIRRLDVSTLVAARESTGEQLFSASIKSLGLVEPMDLLMVPFDSIVAFCRRFTALEDLHIIVDQEEPRNAEEPIFKQMWGAILRLRDRLKVLGLKRLFFEIKYLGIFHEDKPGWIDRLKQTEPLEQAAFSTSPCDSRLRMFFKLSWPREELPTFFRIKGQFNDMEDESAEDTSDWSDDEDESSSDESSDYDSMDSFDSMDEEEKTDEGAVDGAGVY
ncbi:hypothetical protein M3Y99_00819200 [Aphelenchoides fujianensis]|nr:hypothetical protein M3Y99_00819200 [Aphelenchoides fujianensis]